MGNNSTNELPVSITKTSVILGFFALLAALLLGIVNLATADRIQEQQRIAERRALAEVFPENLHDNDLLLDTFTLTPDDPAFSEPELLQLSTSRQAYTGQLNGLFSGTILPVEAHDAYSGNILILVGVLADGQVSAVRVLAHKETPGLGDKIDISISDWILGFDGKSLLNPTQSRWKVIKAGGEFDQLVGATITTRAVVDAVERALTFFQLNQNKLANATNQF